MRETSGRPVKVRNTYRRRVSVRSEAAGAAQTGVAAAWNSNITENVNAKTSLMHKSIPWLIMEILLVKMLVFWSCI